RDLEGHPQRAEHVGVVEQLRVPVEGEARPGEPTPGAVEAEHDQHDDRREQDHVGRDRQRGEPATRPAAHALAPITSRRRLRSAMRVPTMVTPMSRKPSADPYGQSRPVVKMTWIRLAIVVVWAPPSTSGVT